MLQLSCRQTKAVCVKLHRINHCQPQYILHLAPGCAGLTKMWAQNVLWEGFSCKTHICCDFLAHCYFLLSRLGNIDPDPNVNNKGHLNASEFLASTWLINWGSIAFGKRFVGEIAEALAPDANSSHFLLKSTFDGMGVQLLHRLMLAMRNKRRRCFAKLSSPSSLAVRPYLFMIF